MTAPLLLQCSARQTWRTELIRIIRMSAWQVLDDLQRETEELDRVLIVTRRVSGSSACGRHRLLLEMLLLRVQVYAVQVGVEVPVHVEVEVRARSRMHAIN